MAEAKNDVTIGPKFALGKIVATPAALERLVEAGADPSSLIHRHLVGDWGEIPHEDRKTNEYALANDERLMSVYLVGDVGSPKVWIITEADRSVTTILCPEDY